MATTVLDGVGLARERAPALAQRAQRVQSGRGYAPRLILLAFEEEDGTVLHIGRKLRDCAAVGIEAVAVTPAHAASAETALDELAAALQERPVDGVFAQFPFPPWIDGDAIAAAIPEALDVDVMTTGRVRAYLDHSSPFPPVTVSAGLLLLDAYDIDVSGRSGVVVADESPFALMFRESLARRGASMQPLLSPDATDLTERAGAAQLVVAAAARPALLDASALAAGGVAIDVGYFNPGARGDIDITRGFGQLSAIAPVPGGIGPMTVSALLERVITFAEATPCDR